MDRVPVLPFTMIEGDSPWTVLSPDLDLHPTHIESITRLDNDFMITMKGGGGEMWNPATGSIVAVAEVSATFTFRWLPTGRADIDDFVNERLDALGDILSRWQSNQTSLRVLSGENRQVYLIENGSLDRWVAVPRSPGMTPFTNH